MAEREIARAELDQQLQKLERGDIIYTTQVFELLQIQFLREISDELHQINLNTHPSAASLITNRDR